MSEVIVVQLQGGGKLYFGPDNGGLRHIGVGDKIVSRAKGDFEKALGTIGDLVAILDEKIGALATKPSKVELEFGASLSGDCNLWVVSGEGKAEFKVKLVWE